MTRILCRLADDERGASLVEYSVVIGLIAAAAIALIQTVGANKIRLTWSDLNDDWQDIIIRLMNSEYNANNPSN